MDSTIVFIDDDILFHRIYKHILKELGYMKVFCFTNFDDALEYFAIVKVDICFLDYMVAGCEWNGEEIFQMLSQAFPDTKYYILTCADEYTGSKIQNRNKGLKVLYKPLSKNRLIKLIKTIT